MEIARVSLVLVKKAIRTRFSILAHNNVVKVRQAGRLVEVLL